MIAIMDPARYKMNRGRGPIRLVITRLSIYFIASISTRLSTMSDKPWIKLIWPAYRYRSSCRGHRWVNVKARCAHRSKHPMLAARAMLAYRPQLKLYIDDREYEFPYKGVGRGHTFTLNYRQEAEDHIRHCVDLHKGFFNEQD